MSSDCVSCSTAPNRRAADELSAGGRLEGPAASETASPASPARTTVTDAGTDTADAVRRAGCFVAVVGPSGAGKDTLLQLAAIRLEADPAVHFARRVVTRVAHAAIEDHDELLPHAFDAAERAGHFCLSWHAHGLGYGLPVELDDELVAGRTIVANVSRRILKTAARRFARLAVVEITAPHSVLVSRLAARGRETPLAIEARLARQVELTPPDGAEALHRIVNDDTAEAGADALVTFIRQVDAA